MLEILQLSMELMLVFEPPQDSWKLSLNHRGLINAVLNGLAIDSEIQTQVVRTMDKRHKLPRDKFDGMLADVGLDDTQVAGVVQFLETEKLADIAIDHASVGELQVVIEKLTEM